MPVDAMLQALGAVLGLSPTTRLGGWQLRGVLRHGQGIRLRWGLGEGEVGIDLTPRRADAPHYRQTPSFNLTHTRAEGNLALALPGLLASLLDHLQAHDKGGLTLPASVARPLGPGPGGDST